VFELDPSDPAVRANALAALADALFRQDEERGALEALVELERHMPEHPMCARLAREAELRGLR
jgi:hypothetical protein